MVEDTRNSGDELVTIASLEEFFHDSMDAALSTNQAASAASGGGD